MPVGGLINLTWILRFILLNVVIFAYTLKLGGGGSSNIKFCASKFKQWVCCEKKCNPPPSDATCLEKDTWMSRKIICPLYPLTLKWYNSIKHSKNTNIVHCILYIPSLQRKITPKDICKWCMVASVLHFKTTDATSLKKSTYQFFEFFTSFIRFPFYLLFFHFFLRPFNFKEQIC